MDRLSFTSGDIRTSLAQAREAQAHPRVIERLEWLLHYAESGYNASDTCRTFNIARTTFYRFALRFDPANLSTLEDRTHRPHRARQSAVSPTAVQMIREYQTLHPEYGRKKITEALSITHGIRLSEAMVGRIMRKHRRELPSTAIHTTISTITPTTPVPLALAQPMPEPLPQTGRRERRLSWAMLRQALLLTSVVGNLLLIAGFVATVAMEANRGTANEAPLHAAASQSTGSGQTIQVTHIVDGGGTETSALPSRTLELIYRNMH